MHLRSLALAAAFFTCTATALAAPAPPAVRNIKQFTEGWRFIHADPTGAQQPGFDDNAWRSVTLPQDWAIAGPVDQNAATRAAGGFFPVGIGWYRKTFTVPASDAAPEEPRRTFIVFDGVMANSDVYLNGNLLGHRPYGYVSFVYELSPHLVAGKNIIAVRVDNSQQPASRWYPGAGINRQVRLVTTGDTHIVPWGTFVTTPSVSRTGGDCTRPQHRTQRVGQAGIRVAAGPHHRPERIRRPQADLIRCAALARSWRDRRPRSRWRGPKPGPLGPEPRLTVQS